MTQFYLTTTFPLVSVIIPAYNAEKFITETLLSVINQTYQNLEIIVVDDGSQDRTPQIVENFIKTYSKIRLLQQSNQGVAAARNLGIKNAKGEYIAPLDADDIWYPQKIEKQVKCFLEADNSVGLVYAWSLGIDEEGFFNRRQYIVPTIEGNIFLPLIFVNVINTASTPLIRRSCLEAVGNYSCELKQQNAQGCEDWELYLRLAPHYQFRLVPEVLVGYRRVVGSMSRNHDTMAKSMLLTLNKIKEKYPNIPHYFFSWSSGNFYRYLAGQSQGTANHQRTLFWFYKALQSDPANYLDHNLYLRILIAVSKLIACPVTSLIWPDHLAWEKFRRQFILWKYITWEQVKIETNPWRKNQWNLYQSTKRKRWFKIISLFQKDFNIPHNSNQLIKNRK